MHLGQFHAIVSKHNLLLLPSLFEHSLDAHSPPAPTGKLLVERFPTFHEEYQLAVEAWAEIEREDDIVKLGN